MKNYKKIFISSIFLLSLSVHAKQEMVGVVTLLKGKAFGFYEGRTFEIMEGYRLPSGTEVMTEGKSRVSFMDFYERKYDLSDFSHIKIGKHALYLKRGNLWVKSFQKKKRLTMRTANAHLEFLSGEGVLSFDGGNGRSQLLALKGEFKFSHFLDTNRYEVIQPGEFSFVSSKMEFPRKPTPIGFDSYEKVISLFRSSPLRKGRTRFPASVSKKSFKSGQVRRMKLDLKNLYTKKNKKG